MSTTLATPRLSLRALEPADAQALLAYRGLPEVSRYQGWEPRTLEDAAAFIAALHPPEAAPTGQWVQYGILLRDGGAVVGDCGFRFTDADARQAEIGITLAPRHQGRGLATEALKALLDSLFQQPATHRVTASVDPRNTPSLALMRRLGLRQEALLLESCPFRGGWADDAVFAILRREWAGAGPA